VVPEAEPVVASFRARFAAASVAHEIPAHALLIPYVAAMQLDAIAVAAAREHFRSLELLNEPADGTWVAAQRFPFGV
jgi:hypothetical protein